MRSAARPRHLGLLAAAALTALVLGGCAETEFLVNTAKRTQEPVPQQPPGSGRYKVGTPYQIEGIWYYPAEDYDYRETGIASWYGPGFHGRSTANGETYDQNALTAAHRTLPMPSVVRVTNLENGRSIVLTVNDRGPFARGRIIDVSRRGAQLLGFERNGTAKVKVEILPEESQQIKLASLNSPEGRRDQLQVAAAPRETVAAEPLPPVPGGPDTQIARVPPARTPPATAPRAPVTPQPPPVAAARPPVAQPPRLTDKVDILPVSPTGIYVQAGAFGRLDNALRMRDRLQSLGSTHISRTSSTNGDLYRVRVGPLDTVDQADALLTQVISCCQREALIIVE
ncbi:MAG: septal ring lytic transglycosylase RlpA family protein [Alphaproteobacteria bacterium]